MFRSLACSVRGCDAGTLMARHCLHHMATHQLSWHASAPPTTKAYGSPSPHPKFARVCAPSCRNRTWTSTVRDQGRSGTPHCGRSRCTRYRNDTKHIGTLANRRSTCSEASAYGECGRPIARPNTHQPPSFGTKVSPLRPCSDQPRPTPLTLYAHNVHVHPDPSEQGTIRELFQQE